MFAKPLKDQKIFREFCEIGVDRKKIIISILEKNRIPYTTLHIENSFHIVIYPKNLVTGEETNVLLAHYDRVKGTPGANDNSASVFYLLNHSMRLRKQEHRTVIIFTDKEEVQNGESITEQGSYGLGKYFRSKNIENLNFFVFDMCGIGNTILLGTGGENLLKKHYGDNFNTSGFKKKIDRVKQNAEEILLTVNSGEFFYLTPLFSDDLGLILNKYPAVLISLLPYREVIEYKKDVSVLPKSWLCNHTINDDVSTLDNKSWNTLSPLLSRLSNLPSENRGTIKETTFSFNCYRQSVNSLYISRGGIKNINDYILEPSFKIKLEGCKNRESVERVLLFSSKIKSSSAAYISSIIPRKTEDLSFDLYNYLQKNLKDDLANIPKKFYNSIKKIALNNQLTILDYLYNTTIESIKCGYLISSTPIKDKNIIEIEFIDYKEIIIKSDNKIIGKIELSMDKYGCNLESGYFYPREFIRLDPFNLLKGIRLLLIKWVKLNNNNSLNISLLRSNWVGCDQLYRLLEMEMEGKTSVVGFPQKKYIWKRYNGQ